MTAIGAQLRARLGIHWPILFNAGSLVGTFAVNSALGFAYWWLAARGFAPAAVGFASAAISAMTLLGTFGVLGLGTLLIGELPQRAGTRGALITTTVLAAGLAGGVLGMGFALGAFLISPDLRPLGADPGTVALFALGAGLTAATLVLDQSLIGLLRGGLQFARNALFGLAKLVVLAALVRWAGGSGMTIYLSWTLGAAIALGLLLARLAWLAGGPRRALWPRPALLRGLGRAAVAHHFLNVALQVTGQIMPLLVTAILSTTANAYFYTASMVAGLLFVGPISLATVFYAVGAAEPALLSRRLRLTLGLALGVAALGNGVLWLAAGPLLSLFGPSYAQEATLPLQLFGLQAFTFVIREHYVALNRVRGRPTGAVPLVLAGSGVKLGLAAAGAALGGLVGLGVGVVAGATIEAAVMAPTVYRAARGRDTFEAGSAENGPPAMLAGAGAGPAGPARSAR